MVKERTEKEAWGEVDAYFEKKHKEEWKKRMGGFGNRAFLLFSVLITIVFVVLSLNNIVYFYDLISIAVPLVLIYFLLATFFFLKVSPFCSYPFFILIFAILNMTELQLHDYLKEGAVLISMLVQIVVFSVFVIIALMLFQYLLKKGRKK